LRARSRPAPWWRRRAALWLAGNTLALFVEIGALVALLVSPQLRPHQVAITGAQRLRPAEIREAARISPAQSLLLLRGADIQARLEHLPWVRSAQVDLRLPDEVRIRIREWSPVAILRIGESALFLNEHGRVLGPAGAASSPVMIVAQSGEDRAGRTAIDPRLLGLLREIAPRWGATYGVGLREFQLGRNLELTAVTTPGWRVIFGQMATEQQRASLESKLRSLKALRARVDFQTDPLEYINLMNDRQPVVKTHAPVASPSRRPGRAP